MSWGRITREAPAQAELRPPAPILPALPMITADGSVPRLRD
jgi:hypothetical protein